MPENDNKLQEFLARLRRIEKENEIGETLRRKMVITRRFPSGIRKKTDIAENHDDLPDISGDNMPENKPDNLDELEGENEDEHGDFDMKIILEFVGLLAAVVIFVKIIYPMILKNAVITPETPVQVVKNISTGGYALPMPPSPYIR